MKVLLASLNYSPEPTGIGPYSAGLAEGLQARGHEVQVVTGVPHYPKWKNYTGVHGLRTRETINGVEILRLGHYVPPGGIGFRRALLELTFAAATATVTWKRPDVIVTVSPSLAASAVLVAKSRALSFRGHIPVLVWVQDLYSAGLSELQPAGVRSKLARSLETAMLHRADGVIAIHERLGRILREGYGVHPERMVTLRNWTHVDFERPRVLAHETRKRYGWGDRTVVLHAGNMGRKQGLDAVVDAARLAQKKGKGILFVLLGNGSERARLMAKSEGCLNIQFLETCADEEFKAVLDASNILLVNEVEGVREMALPSKLTTYFAAGKPVVAAVALDGVTADEIRGSGAGIIASPGQPEELLKAIDRLGSDHDLAQLLGAAGIRYANDNLTIDSFLRGFTALLTCTTGAVPRRQATRLMGFDRASG